MSKFMDLTGIRFGLLTVLHRIEPKDNIKIKWLCLCGCGEQTEVRGCNLRSGHTKSCGCLKSKHGHKINGKTSSTYSVRECIDRIDNNEGYSKGNCRWATRKQQARNRNNNVLITYDGRTQCLMAWAEELNICFNTLRYRLKHWPLEKAFTTLLVNQTKGKMYDFYLAGGMRGYPDMNRSLFMSTAKLLRDKGFTIWNPAENDGHPNVTFAECMTLDLNAIINDCRGIALLPGWEKSLGANVEAFVAFVTGGQTVEVIIKKNKTDCDLLPIDLSQYALPYNPQKNRQFDPHKCDLDSFQQTKK